MKRKSASLRGSMLLAMMIVVMVMALAAGLLLEYTANSYRNSMRQQRVVQVKALAETEMEFLYYNWKTKILGQSTAANIPDELNAITLHGSDPIAVNSSITDPSAVTYAPLFTDLPGFTTTRGIRFINPTQVGIIPGTSKTGRISSFVVQTRGTYRDGILGQINFNLGRRFLYSETSLFQFSVFYQGDMEFSAGSNMTVEGDISSNSNIYLASGTAFNLTVTDKVRYANLYNGAADPDSGTQLRKYEDAGRSITFTSGLKDPVFTDTSYDSTPLDGAPPTQADSRHAQVEKLTEQENFLGGVDVDTVLAKFPAAYDGDGDTTVVSDADRNMVYRSVIAPPPSVAEDPTVASRRMYNRAGIIIKIDGTANAGLGTISVIVTKTGVDYASTLISQGVFTSQRSDVFDKRENSVVKMTTIDVAKLKLALDTVSSLGPLKADYNGVVYAYDTTTTSKAGIRLDHGQETPNYNDKGFTVATDNGLYVKGDYNTVLKPDSTKNSTALMGDAVTILSQAWVDKPADSLLSTRMAHGVVIDGDGKEITTVVAAIVSGNTPSIDGTANGGSGGVQNLVRYLENWQGTNQRVRLDGSLGQLFTSTHFNGQYRAGGNGAQVYYQPVDRVYAFNHNLATNPPGGAPTTTLFRRGNYFNW